MTIMPSRPDTQALPDLPRDAVAIITNDHGEILLHLRDDIGGIARPGHWSVPVI